MIGIRSAFSIRARGHRPHLEAVYMTAPRSVCRNTKKALPTGGRPYMTVMERTASQSSLREAKRRSNPHLLLCEMDCFAPHDEKSIDFLSAKSANRKFTYTFTA